MLASPSLCDYSAVRTHSSIAFQAAMPPLLRGYEGGTGSHALDASSLLLSGGRYGCPGLTSVNLSSDAVAPRVMATRLSHDGGVLSSFIGGGRLGGSSSLQEVSLLRREVELRAEFHRLRAEDNEQSRLRVEQQRRDEDAEERRRLLTMAREVEEARAKRIDEQQERLLQRERELEEWKADRMKESDARRRAEAEEEDRRRELQYQRELSRMKAEADAHAASRKQADNANQFLERSLVEAQAAMTQRIKEELAAREAAHTAELARRDGEWTQRVEAMEVARATEMANITLRMQQDYDRACRGEQQLSEARDQLQRLVSEIEGLRAQRSGSAAADASSLAETHKSAIARLQQMYEDDKRESLRAFTAERDRLKYEQERRNDEMKDACSAQMRAKADEVESLERRLAQADHELQEVKAKSVFGRGGGTGDDPYGMQENSKLKDEARALKATILELEDGKRRLERRLRDADERAASQTAAVQGMQKDLVARSKQNEQEAEALRREAQDARVTLSKERDAHEEELANLRRQVREAEDAATAQSSRDAEATTQKLREHHEAARQEWESARLALTKRIAASEESASSARRQCESTQRELAAARADLQRQQQVLEEKSAALKSALTDAESKSEVEFRLRDAQRRCEQLTSELESDRQRWQSQSDTSVAAKERELQDARKELAEARKTVQTLREEVSSSKYGKEEFQQKLGRDLAAREADVVQLRREVETGKHAQEEWKASYAELEKQKERATASLQQTLRDREEETRSLRGQLNAAHDAKAAAEMALRTQETKLLTSSSRDGEAQRILRERDEAITRLTAEVQQLRDDQQRQRQTEQQLRQDILTAQASSVLEAAPAAASTNASPLSPVPSLPAPLAPFAAPAVKSVPLTPVIASPAALSTPAGPASPIPPVPAHPEPVAKAPSLSPHLLEPPQSSPSPPPVPAPAPAPAPVSVPVPAQKQQVPAAASWLSPPSFSGLRATAVTAPPLAAPPAASAPAAVPVPQPAAPVLANPPPPPPPPRPVLSVPAVAILHTTHSPSDSLTSPLTIPVPVDLTSGSRGTTPTLQVAKPSTQAAPIAVSVPVPAGALSHSALPVPVVGSPSVAAGLASPRTYALDSVPVPTARSPLSPAAALRSPTKPPAPSLPVPAPAPASSPAVVTVPASSSVGGYFAGRPAPTPVAVPAVPAPVASAAGAAPPPPVAVPVSVPLPASKSSSATHRHHHHHRSD